MEEIARRSRVSKGLIYTYFRNKEALLTAVIGEGMTAISRFLPDTATGEPRAALAAMVRASFGMVRTQRTFVSLYLSLLTHPAVIRRHRTSLLRVLDRFRSAVASGLEASGHTDADRRALVLIATLDGVMLHYLIGGEGYPLEEVRDLILCDWLDEKETR